MKSSLPSSLSPRNSTVHLPPPPQFPTNRLPSASTSLVPQFSPPPFPSSSQPPPKPPWITSSSMENPNSSTQDKLPSEEDLPNHPTNEVNRQSNILDEEQTRQENSAEMDQIQTSDEEHTEITVPSGHVQHFEFTHAKVRRNAMQEDSETG
ncbi:hypothetical protein Salat_2654600 [Sesamum alatum]|uniref:Uncharacterized protein n=1 Tax=Sesamum alatum TaxID=300844 RepID=A0AAE2CAZ1_9LAMI|nr:hypothetical protein Salat_2654600 [Sesamum alatum]